MEKIRSESFQEELHSASKYKQKFEEAEEEFHLAVDVLTEERDAARQKEEEYFEELQATSNDLADIQTGYVDLSDRLNDKTDQIFEVQELLDEEKSKSLQLRESLGQPFFFMVFFFSAIRWAYTMDILLSCSIFC